MHVRKTILLNVKSLSSMIMYSTYMSCDMNKEDQIRTQNIIYQTFMEDDA